MLHFWPLNMRMLGISNTFKKLYQKKLTKKLEKLDIRQPDATPYHHLLHKTPMSSMMITQPSQHCM
jgi:hypothetical protein